MPHSRDCQYERYLIVAAVLQYAFFWMKSVKFYANYFARYNRLNPLLLSMNNLFYETVRQYRPGSGCLRRERRILAWILVW